MQTNWTKIAGCRTIAPPLFRAAIIVGLGLLACACNTDQQIAAVPATPTDYRLRHPITIQEADRTFELFIASGRGALTAAQRAEVLAFAQTWRSEAAGGVIVDLPVGTGNQRAAGEAMPEIRSILAASGVPPRSILVRGYHPPQHMLATIRISYPKIIAQAGPCGMWPEDIGPSLNRDYYENQPYWNFGCAQQRNLAAMVDNPADLVQPRGETPAYAMRRTTVVDKYSQGQPTATNYPSTDLAKISTGVGQ